MDALRTALDSPITDEALIELLEAQLEGCTREDARTVLLAVLEELRQKLHPAAAKSLRQRRGRRMKELVNFVEEGRIHPPLPTIFDDTVYE